MIRKNTMNFTTQLEEELLDKYRSIDQNYITPLSIRYNKLFDIDFSKLTIDPGYHRYYYDNQGYIWAIQLREIKQEKKLLIGCGNNPTSIYYNYPLAESRTKLVNNHSIYSNNYSCCKDHLHQDCITIDSDLGMNPTFVTSFGKKKLYFLKDHSFDSIEMEGLDISYFPYFNSEKKRILNTAVL